MYYVVYERSERMSRRFGPILQHCYLVDELAPALAHWTGVLGIGPFFILPPRRFVWLLFRGRLAPSHAINAGLALGYSGETQIELIVPGTAPSPYRDFLDLGGSGVHHLGFAARDFERRREEALASGMRVVMEGASTLTRFAYLEDDPAYPGTLVELIEMSDEVERIFASIHAASVGWDGSDPVRSLPV